MRWDGPPCSGLSPEAEGAAYSPVGEPGSGGEGLLGWAAPEEGEGMVSG